MGCITGSVWSKRCSFPYVFRHLVYQIELDLGIDSPEDEPPVPVRSPGISYISSIFGSCKGNPIVIGMLATSLSPLEGYPYKKWMALTFSRLFSLSKANLIFLCSIYNMYLYVYIYNLIIYIYVHVEPQWPLFWMEKGLLFEGSNPKKGHSQVPGMPKLLRILLRKGIPIAWKWQNSIDTNSWWRMFFSPSS